MFGHVQRQHQIEGCIGKGRGLDIFVLPFVHLAAEGLVRKIVRADVIGGLCPDLHRDTPVHRRTFVDLARAPVGHLALQHMSQRTLTRG